MVNRMFHPTHDREGNEGMTHRTYATQANDVAGNARVRAFQPCPVSPAVMAWSPISLGYATTTKHGRPRRHEVSHP
jgi:hypothetical protein